MTIPGPSPHQPTGDAVDPALRAPGDPAALQHLLAITSRLSAELAATQLAVQELTAQIARAAMGVPTVVPVAPGAPGAAPSAPAAVAAQASAAATNGATATNGDAAADPASALPPRRGDHAVASDDPAEDQAAVALQQQQQQQQQPAAAPESDPTPALTAVRPLDGEWSATPPNAPAAPAGLPVSPFDGTRRERPPSLADVPLLSAGSVEVLMGPVRSLTDLDVLQGRIIEMPGVETATVTAFEGQDVLMSVDLDRPLPLASMLRTELGRDVESCRLVEGRIVVTFTLEGRTA